jgi:hypothetical protein
VAAPVVLDHGPTYRLARFATSGSEGTKRPAFDSWWERTARSWAQILQLVVLLDAPDDELVRRIRSRPRDHVVKHMSGDMAAAFLDRYRCALARTADVLTVSGSVQRLDIDTTAGDVDGVVREVLRVSDRVPDRA